MNEPTTGTPRKSQIQTYLEQNEGPGLQHMALKTDDIFHTLKWVLGASSCMCLSSPFFMFYINHRARKINGIHPTR